MMFSYETAVLLVCILSAMLCVGVSMKKGLGWRTGLCMSALSFLCCMLCARGY